MTINTNTTTDEPFTSCPACSGELEYQDILNVYCLECGDAFAHYVLSTGTDVLNNEEGERVASRPAANTEE